MSKVIKVTPKIVLALCLTIFSSLFGVAIPIALKSAIDGRSMFGLNSEIALLALFIVQTICITSGSYLMAKASEVQIRLIRETLYQHLIYARKQFFDHEKSGELAAHVVNDTNNIRSFLTDNLVSFVAGVVTIVGSLISLVVLDVKLSLVLIASLPIVLIVIIPLSNLSQKYASETQDQLAGTTGMLTETFRNVASVKANTAEKTLVKLVTNKFRKLYKLSLKSDLLEAISSPLVLLLLFGAVAVIFTYGGKRVTAGTLTVGTLMSFLIYLFQLLNPLGGLSEFFVSYARVKGATSKISELLAVEVEMQDGLQQIPTGDLAFNQVNFSYGDKKVLNAVSLNFPAKQKIAIVGPSGGGKSTIISLIERFYPAVDGEITIAGKGVNEFDLKAWRENFAVVSQENNIIAGSVRDNLLFGLTDEFSDAELIRAIEQAGLLTDFNSFADGLDTEVGENGVLLSGGQKQRLQIARAYLRQAPYIIFDEATANLDADAEYIVTQSLNKLLENRTAIIVAHRLSTIADADRIYFLENNQITGCGSHSELMATHTSYKRFVQEQMIE